MAGEKRIDSLGGGETESGKRKAESGNGRKYRNVYGNVICMRLKKKGMGERKKNFVRRFHRFTQIERKG
jgi:hypothetical protein